VLSSSAHSNLLDLLSVDRPLGSPRNAMEGNSKNLGLSPAERQQRAAELRRAQVCVRSVSISSAELRAQAGVRCRT
jgi:hypothetical protein